MIHVEAKQNIREHRVIFLLTDLGDGLLQDLANVVDDNVDLAKVLQGVLEELGDGACGGEISLVEGHLDGGVLLLQFLLELDAIVLGAGRVVVESKIGTGVSQLAGSGSTEVLGTSSDKSDLALERHGYGGSGGSGGDNWSTRIKEKKKQN